MQWLEGFRVPMLIMDDEPVGRVKKLCRFGVNGSARKQQAVKVPRLRRYR
jgi:hypothetical protein